MDPVRSVKRRRSAGGSTILAVSFGDLTFLLLFGVMILLVMERSKLFSQAEESERLRTELEGASEKVALAQSGRNEPNVKAGLSNVPPPCTDEHGSTKMYALIEVLGEDYFMFRGEPMGLDEIERITQEDRAWARERKCLHLVEATVHFSTGVETYVKGVKKLRRLFHVRQLVEGRKP